MKKENECIDTYVDKEERIPYMKRHPIYFPVFVVFVVLKFYTTAIILMGTRHRHSTPHKNNISVSLETVCLRGGGVAQNFSKNVSMSVNKDPVHKIHINLQSLTAFIEWMLAFFFQSFVLAIQSMPKENSTPRLPERANGCLIKSL